MFVEKYRIRQRSGYLNSEQWLKVEKKLFLTLDFSAGAAPIPAGRKGLNSYYSSLDCLLAIV